MPPAPLVMFELTRSKLERAAVRRSPSLREIVLLSNVFGAARPQWQHEQQERERELAAMEQKQKRDEQAWLDGVLEEMLLDEDPYEDDDIDEEDNGFVSISYRDNRPLGDSGYLETNYSGASPSSIPLPALDTVQEELELNDEPPASALPDADEFDDDEDPYPPSIELPPSPPLPPKSPPIPVPAAKALPYLEPPPDSFEDYSSSPPLLPPPLTPDSSPPSTVGTILLGSSFGSLESDMEAAHDRWMDEREQTTKRQGLFALDIAYAKAPSKPTFPSILDMARSPTLFGPPSPPATDVHHFGPVPASPSPSSADTLALALVHVAQREWSPRPPRSLSVPSTPQRQSSPPLDSPFPSFRASTVKSFYGVYDEVVDFGKCTTPGMDVIRGIKALDLSSSWSSSTSSGTDDRGRSHTDLALILRPPNPILTFGENAGASYRSRSVSPEGSPSRREWARLSDVVDAEAIL
ncbi:hypothetical protein MNV49_006783 [Pseudohyphozyma bogoriensis]|nr:hypothetical protein MNV49_006783 [Pseudohyphozyma bogoriensis]